MDAGSAAGTADPEMPEPAPNVGGTTICVTINGDAITVDAYPVGGQASSTPQQVADIGEALKMVLDVYEQQELPDSGQAEFERGFGTGSKRTPAVKPVMRP